MSRLTDTRLALYGALTNTAGAPWRVWMYPPAQIVAPCVWIDLPRVAVSDQGRGAKFVVSTWQVFVVVDGADDKQVAALDQWVAEVWDALDALPQTDAVTIDPHAIDAGVPPDRSLRGAVLSVEVMHVAKTLCLPLLDPDPAPMAAVT